MQYCEAIGRDPATIERTMGAPVIVGATEAEAQGDVGAAARRIARATVAYGGPEQAAEALQPYVDAGFTGLHVQQQPVSLDRPDRGPRRGPAASSSREAVPVPRRARRRRGRPVARRGRPPSRGDRLLGGRVRRTTWWLPFGIVPLLTWAAAATERMRVMPFVANNDLRHPAILAQDLASLDVLSGGRVEVAIGAGWNRPEYDAIGLPFDAVGTRVGRLAEAIAVVKGSFGDGPFSFAGEHYTITDHDGLPKPVQRPRPPLFIGGGGKRVLTLAGREADIVSLAPRTLTARVGRGASARDPRSITIAATEEKIGWIREAAGDRFADIELNVYPTGIAPQVTDHPRKVAADLLDGIRARTGRRGRRRRVPRVAATCSSGRSTGSRPRSQELRERLGISSFMVGDLDTLAPVVERLAGT